MKMRWDSNPGSQHHDSLITYIIFFPTCVTGFHSCNYRYRSLLLLFHLNEFAFGSLWLKIRGILLEGEVTCVFKIY